MSLPLTELACAIQAEVPQLVERTLIHEGESSVLEKQCSRLKIRIEEAKTRIHQSREEQNSLRQCIITIRSLNRNSNSYARCMSIFSDPSYEFLLFKVSLHFASYYRHQPGNSDTDSASYASFNCMLPSFLNLTWSHHFRSAKELSRTSPVNHPSRPAQRERESFFQMK